MDIQQLTFEAIALGLSEHLFDLSQSRLPDRREALMAAAPHCWGLFLWINGGSYVFLDEKGFVCETKDADLITRLCLFESTQGVGALRALLSRPATDPTVAIEYLASKVVARKRAQAEPEVKLRRTVLTPTAFKNLLEEL